MRKATIIQGDSLAVLRAMPAGSVHCCVTSPPYWGLRDYGVAGQFGLERSPAEYSDKMVEVFAEVRRVLRDDGTLWLNMGDCYANDGKWGGATGGRHVAALHGNSGIGRGRRGTGLKPKDLVGMPWRLAFALQEDGWWLRRDIIWSKPNPMPESVTDRPTTAHEYIFLLSKSERYFYDAEAVREVATGRHHPVAGWASGPGCHSAVDHSRAKGNAKSFRGGGKYTSGRGFGAEKVDRASHGNAPNESGRRNLRSVWTIATAPFKEAHFATFPPELARRCIAVGTSERGCCSECGAPWVRQVSINYENPGNRSTNGPRSEERKHQEHGSAGYAQRLERRASTSGWRRSCRCEVDLEPVPCTVLDPFSGAGTTAMVALRMGRHAIGIELNAEYCAMAERRIRGDAPLLNSVEMVTYGEPQAIRGGRAA